MSFLQCIWRRLEILTFDTNPLKLSVAGTLMLTLVVSQFLQREPALAEVRSERDTTIDLYVKIEEATRVYILTLERLQKLFVESSSELKVIYEDFISKNPAISQEQRGVFVKLGLDFLRASVSQSGMHSDASQSLIQAAVKAIQNNNHQFVNNKSYESRILLVNENLHKMSSLQRELRNLDESRKQAIVNAENAGLFNYVILTEAEQIITKTDKPDAALNGLWIPSGLNCNSFNVTSQPNANEWLVVVGRKFVLPGTICEASVDLPKENEFSKLVFNCEGRVNGSVDVTMSGIENPAFLQFGSGKKNSLIQCTPDIPKWATDLLVKTGKPGNNFFGLWAKDASKCDLASGEDPPEDESWIFVGDRNFYAYDMSCRQIKFKQTGNNLRRYSALCTSFDYNEEKLNFTLEKSRSALIYSGVSDKKLVFDQYCGRDLPIWLANKIKQGDGKESKSKNEGSGTTNTPTSQTKSPSFGDRGYSVDVVEGQLLNALLAKNDVDAINALRGILPRGIPCERTPLGHLVCTSNQLATMSFGVVSGNREYISVQIEPTASRLVAAGVLMASNNGIVNENNHLIAELMIKLARGLGLPTSEVERCVGDRRFANALFSVDQYKIDLVKNGLRINCQSGHTEFGKYNIRILVNRDNRF
jgi:hypothetical protein